MRRRFFLGFGSVGVSVGRHGIMSDWKLTGGGVAVLGREASLSVDITDNKSVSRLSVEESRVVVEETELAVSSTVHAVAIEFV